MRLVKSTVTIFCTSSAKKIYYYLGIVFAMPGAHKCECCVFSVQPSSSSSRMCYCASCDDYTKMAIYCLSIFIAFLPIYLYVKQYFQPKTFPKSLNYVYKTNIYCFQFGSWLQYRPLVISKPYYAPQFHFGAQHSSEISLGPLSFYPCPS